MTAALALAFSGGTEGAEMTGPEGALAMWSEPAVPPLDLVPVATPTAMDRTMEEGTTWPSAQAVRDAAVPPDLVAEERTATAEWLSRVLSPDTVPPDGVEEHLVAVRGLVGGRDGFLAAWMALGRPLHVLVSRDRLHLVTVVPGNGGADVAVAVANDLLELDAPLSPDHLETMEVRGATLLFPRATEAQGWQDTVTVLVGDGVAKISVLKVLFDTASIQRTELKPPETPWFEGRR